MKNFTAILLGFLTLLAFSACAAVQEAQPPVVETPPEPPAITRTAAKLGILTHATETGQQTLLQLQKQSMQDLTVSLFTGESPGDFKEQPLQAVAANIPTDNVGEQLLQLSQTKGLPLLFYGTKPSNKIMEASDNLRFIGSRTQERGTAMGEIALKLWDEQPELDRNGDGKLQYVLLGTEDGVTEQAVNVIEAAGVDTAVLGEEGKITESVTAASYLSSLLTQDETAVEMVLCSGEASATGAVMALQSMGYNTKEGDKTIPIVVWGETAALKKMADSGAVSGVAVPDSETEAAVLLGMANNLADGNDMMEGLSVDYDPQTKTIPIPCKLYLGTTQVTAAAG